MGQVLAHTRFFRRIATACGVILLFSGVPAAGGQSEPVATFELGAGDEVFWDGPEHLSQPVPLPSEVRAAICAAGGPGCLDYRLVLSEPGERLRVAIDREVDIDLYEGEFVALYLLDPAGNEAGHFGLPELFYSAELFAEDPAPGAWTVRVVPEFALDSGPFRLRAKLEASSSEINHNPHHAKKPREAETLLPNLRMQPPYEFTLDTPAFIGGYGALGFDIGPARGVLPTSGCLAVEIARHEAERCLRFSTGPENIGRGRLQLFFRPDGSGLTEGPAFQRLDRSDGTTVDDPAGRYEYHLEHAHYHHGAFARFLLLHVDDPTTGSLTQVGTGPKRGFCISEYKIVNWEAFDNQPQETVQQNCPLNTGTLPTEESVMGLARGWADAYIYPQEGQYVEFGDSPDGLYVVRVRANDENAIQESTTKDNFAYALVEIKRNEVVVLERGYGRDPWDPHKKVVINLLPLNADD